MDHASIGALVLKVQKPPFTRGRVDQRALMWAVDRSAALIEHDAMLVRATDISRPENRLPAFGYAARGSKNIVPAIALIELRSFERAESRHRHLVPVNNNSKVALDLRAVGRQRQQCQPVADSSAAFGPPVNQVKFSIVI